MNAPQIHTTQDEQDVQALRQEVDALRAALERSCLITDRHIRQAIRQKVQRIRRENIGLALLVLLGGLCWGFIWWTHIISTPLLLFVTVWFLIEITSVFYLQTLLNPDIAARQSLVAYIRRVERFRRLQRRGECISLPIALIVIAWLFYEINTQLPAEFARGIIIGGCVGGIAGGIIGFRKFFADQRRAREIIAECRELQGEASESA